MIKWFQCNGLLGHDSVHQVESTQMFKSNLLSYNLPLVMHYSSEMFAQIDNKMFAQNTTELPDGLSSVSHLTL